MASKVNWDQQDFSKSSYSGGGSDSNCLEVATVEGRVGIRDTKDRRRVVTVDVPARAWTAFVDGLRGGDFAR